MGESRQGYNLLKTPKELFKIRNWKQNKKLMFYDTVKPLICILRGHRIYTTDDFDPSPPNFVCGFIIIRHYWLACKFCQNYLPKGMSTKRDRLVGYNGQIINKGI